ncbi:MAG: SH3 domain-containing protein [Labilithrix sp.]|nr:SH3 domain-containing protein [Labilithrix sp.]
MSQLVPTRRTTPTMAELAAAILRAWPDATKPALGVLYAQFAGETGKGLHCYGFNLANVKWTPGCGWDYHALLGVWEGVTPAAAERLIATGQWAPDPSKDHAIAVGPGKVSIIATQSNPASWFRAYPDLGTGARVYVTSKQPDPNLPPEKQPRYASAWPFVVAGDCDGYARELGRKGYYTASPDAYSRAMLAHHAEWMRSTGYEEAKGMPLPEPLSIRAGARVRVTASALNVRATPATSATILARLPGGTIVETLSANERDWVEVRVGPAITGWVATAHVAIVDADEPELDDAPAMPTVDMVTGETWVLPFEIVRPRLEEQLLVQRCPRCSRVSCSGDCS